MDESNSKKIIISWFKQIDRISNETFIRNFIPEIDISTASCHRLINNNFKHLPPYPGSEKYIEFFNNDNELIRLLKNNDISCDDLAPLITSLQEYYRDNASIKRSFWNKLEDNFSTNQYQLFLSMLSSLIIYEQVQELDKYIDYENKLYSLFQGSKWTIKHLYEYINNVVLKTGISGLAGTREIQFYASQKNNPFILYEAGELEYYNREAPDFDKAFYYYELAWDRFEFPLAAWSIGYMYMKQGIVDTIIGNTVHVKEFEMMTEIERYEKAAYYFTKAASKGCGSAFNSLGNMCKSNLPDIIWDTLKTNYITDKNEWLALQEYYYTKAADLGNTDGLYNLSRFYINKIKYAFNTGENPRNMKEYKSKIVENLSIAEKYNHVKALNELGLIYLHESDWDHYKPEHTPHLVDKDPQHAEELLKKAAEGYGSDKWYWANYNYAKYCLTNRLNNKIILDEIILNYKKVLDSDSAPLCKALTCKELANLCKQNFITKKDFQELTSLHMSSLLLHNNTVTIYNEVTLIIEGI